jgi:asparagine synthase (glutamine-hydrolysing)
MTHTGVTSTLVVVSRRPGVGGHGWAETQRRMMAAIGARDGKESVHILELGLTVVVTSKLPATRGTSYLTVPGEDGEGVLNPPAATLDIRDETVTIRSDRLGMKHVYTLESRDYCAASTSAGVLAGLAGSRLDQEAIAQLALFGFLLGTKSMFEDVRLAAGGSAVILSRGELHVTPQAASGHAQARNGPDAVRRAVAGLLAGSPTAVLELSGGLDSRVILAGMSRSDRAGRVAFTIDGGDGADARMARTLAAGSGLEHVVISGQPWGGRDPLDVRQRVDRAALVREFASNALAAATIDLIEEQAPSGARLTGVNGEYVRGFYYPGTLSREPVSRSSVARVMRWRMVTNERVSDSLLAPEWRADHAHDLVDRLTRDLRERSCSLRVALDEFYLHDRVRRWAGPSYSNAAVQRRILAPFLHPVFLNWASSVGVRERAGSQALARVLCELDPELGGLPLADGRTPHRIAAPRPPDRATSVSRRGIKVLRKVDQRVRGSRRPPGGAGEILRSLREAWSVDPPFGQLARLEFLDQGQLERWSSDPSGLDSSTSSFLVNLSNALDLLRRAEMSTSVRSSSDASLP